MRAAFSTLKLEGGLIGYDIIERIASGEEYGQKPSDFGFDSRSRLSDEIAGAWSDARDLWHVLERRLERLPEADLGTTVTRDQWIIPLFSSLDYELIYQPRSTEIDGLTFSISHKAGKDDGSPPVHIVGARQSLDRKPELGRPRLAPHALLQEYLNRTDQVWGLVTNGKILRVLRDSQRMRKQAYIEFDLEQMMAGEKFADFALLYRLVHRTRLPQTLADAHECFLEKYYLLTIEQGGRVRDRLRDGVEEALKIFANGFINNPRNNDLRQEISSGKLTPQHFYRQLLRLIYRFLFLMVAEERNLITNNPIYAEHYSISRLRRLLEIRSSWTVHDDLWLGLRTTFELFRDEELGQYLGVPPLNGDLFNGAEMISLDDASLANRDLLNALWHLGKYREDDRSPWRPINYAALDVEELGSVYESLLEFHPIFIEKDDKLKFDLVPGIERKSTGSYYTPPELVQELIKSALVPVIEDRLKKAPSKEDALLYIRVLDPACGSGHFLLAAARRLGKELAKIRTGDDEPTPESLRLAVRDVITHCVYGVDKNPLAVDLCKVALWIEGHAKNKPLTFLDHRIRCGDSLVGVMDLNVLKDGIPDEAFAPVEGDDKPVARSLKKQNKEEREGQRTLPFETTRELKDLGDTLGILSQIPNDTPDNIRKKSDAYQKLHSLATRWWRDQTACNLWTAAFFVELTSENIRENRIPTYEVLMNYLDSGAADARTTGYSWILAQRHAFFHWPLEFPEVFVEGGFDVVLGNPPWGQKAIKESQRERKLISRKFPSVIGIFDLFRPFIELGIKMTSEYGAIGLVLPDIILLKDYESTRSFILNNLSITSIDWWPSPFPDVTMDAISFIGRRESPKTDNKIKILVHTSSNERPYLIDQGDFISNPRNVFNIFLTAPRRHIIKHLESYPRFGHYFEIHEGVHSGNMRKELFIREAADASCYKMFFGRGEIVPYALSWGGYYLCLSRARNKNKNGSYCNIGQENWHKREKILVRRTGDFVLAAVDYIGLFVSNNFFLIFPKKESFLNLDGTCALLNSKLMTWFFRTIEPRQGRVFAELKIKHLEVFPLPKEILNPEACKPLNELGKWRRELAEIWVDTLGEKERQELKVMIADIDSKIDFLVMNLFNLDKESQDLINEEAKYEK